MWIRGIVAFAAILAAPAAAVARLPSATPAKQDNYVSGVIVGVSPGGGPKVWPVPEEGIDPAKLDPADNKVIEDVTSALRDATEPPVADLSATEIFIATSATSAPLLRKATFDELSANLKGCAYNGTLIIATERPSDEKAILASTYQCADKPASSPLTFVLERHKLAGLYLQIDGAIPVPEKRKS